MHECHRRPGVLQRLEVRTRAVRFVRILTTADRLTAILEQGLLALTRMAALLVFARLMSTELFGAFALVVSISFILNTIQRSVVILPFILSCQKADNVNAAIRQWWWIDLIAIALVALLLLGAWAGAGVLGAAEWVRTALLFSAIGAPPLMIYTFHRRISYQIGDYRCIVLMVLVHILMYAGGILAVVATRETSTLPFLAFALAPAAGAFTGAARISAIVREGPPAGLARTFYHAVPFTKWSFLGGLAGSVYTNGMNIMVGALVGAMGSAAFAATRTIVAPIVSLIAATDMIDKPRAGRAYVASGLAGLRRSVRNTLATLVLLGGPYLLVVSALSGTILELLYGPKYAGLETELRLWALVMLLNMLASPLNTHLTTLRDTRSIFFCNLAGAAITLTIALPLLDQFGVLAGLIGMVCGRAANVALLFHATGRALAGRGSVTPPTGAESTVKAD